MSRAYYAAFHAACDFMRALGFAVPKADRAHGYLWLRLQNGGNSDIAQAGQSLKDLRTHRNRADYEARQAMTQPDAEKYAVDAKVFIQLDRGMRIDRAARGDEIDPSADHHEKEQRRPPKPFLPASLRIKAHRKSSLGRGHPYNIPLQ
ncbi:MAG: HEPN domain-containing protein [Gemmataceae bacterium]|nr:HEPN domain-containing protein [Gemmataceae bacterium]